LGLVAQGDIYFTRDIPNNFQIDGVLASQMGTIIRHGYLQNCGGTTGALKDKMTINGTLVSYFKSYWNYEEGPESGFKEVSLNLRSGNDV